MLEEQLDSKIPLNEEQIKELNEISKLQLENQKERLTNFLKTLTPEQVEFLKKRQPAECIFCLIAKKQIPAKVIYEDGLIMAFLDINPVNKGHALIIPKKHYNVLPQMEDKEVEHLFKIVKYLSGVIFGAVNAEGITVMQRNGKAAGQEVPHVHVHIIPRFKDDGFIEKWEPKKLKEKELNEIFELIKKKITAVKVEKKEEIKESVEEFKEEEEFEEEKVRIP